MRFCRLRKTAYLCNTNSQSWSDDVMGSAKSPPASHHTSGRKPPPRIRGKSQASRLRCFFSFYSLDIAVIQYWTFSRVRLLTPTVILIFPIPVSSYSMIIIRSNGFLICVAGFRLLDRYFLGTSQYGVQLKNSQCLKIILCSMFTGLNNRDHSDVDVLLKR